MDSGVQPSRSGKVPSSIKLKILITRFTHTLRAKWGSPSAFVVPESTLLSRLHRAEQKYEAVFACATDIISVVSPTSIITSLNPAFERVMGWKREEWIGKSFVPLVHPEELHQAQTWFTSNLRGESMPSLELRALTASGDYAYLEFTSAPLIDDGRIVGVMSIGRNITQRKKDEASLQKEEALRRITVAAHARALEFQRQTAKLKSITENVAEGLCLFDTEGRLTYMNPAASKILGWNESELLGHPIHECIRFSGDEEEPKSDMIVSHVLKTKQPLLGHEAQWFTKQGQLISIQCSCSPILEDNRVTGAVLGFWDISVQKKIQMELNKLTSDLARSNQDLEHFARVAAHDLKEPLRMVNCYLDLLRKLHGNTLAPEAMEFIHFAVDGALRMHRLLDGLFQYARLGARHETRELDCEHVVDNALKNLSVLIAETGAEVHVHALPHIWADEDELILLFQNLIGNALKFRSEKPPVIQIYSVTKDGEQRISVEDNGIGLDMQYSDRIFEVFQRLHAREAYSGSGLGLAICKRIVERHQGRIWVESKPGRGSRFSFVLRSEEAA